MDLSTSQSTGFEVGPDPRQGETTKTFSVHEITAAIYRSRFGIALILAICVGIAVAYSLLATRLYTSEVSIEIRQEAEKVLGTEADREGAASKSDTDRFLQTQLEILRSRGVAQTVAENLGLYRGTAFLDTMKIEPAESGTPNQTLQQVRRDQVEQALMANVDVEYSGNTRIAVLSFESPDPALSARVANAYAESFIRNNLSRKFDSSTYALEFLRDRLQEAQARLEQTEQQALAYSRQRRLVDPSNAAGNAGNGPQSLLAAQLIQLNQAYSNAVAERIAAEQRWQRVRSLPDLKIPEVLANQAVQGLQQERAKAAATYSQIVSTRQPNYPTAVESEEQRRELDRQISSIAGNVRDAVESQYRIAVSEENRLRREIEQIKSDTLDEQRAGIQLSILRRAADTSQQQYDSLLRRYSALNAEAGVQTNNLNIVDRASIVETPSWPRLPLLLAMAIFAGLLLSFVFVVLREQLFDAIRAPADVTDRLHLPLLGSVPNTEDIEEDLADPKSPVSEAFNSVRTALALSENGMPRSILFTSTQAGEGKSSSCHALARSITRLGKRAIIVDADLRRPNAHRFFHVKNNLGLTQVLGGTASLEEAIHAPAGDRVLHLLPAGEIPPNPSELVTSPQFLKLVSKLTENYDVVLVDSAPVLGIADAVILANEVETTVFVIEAGRNSVRAVGNALARLRQGGTVNLAGALLTKYDPGQFGYGYTDAQAYQYSYKA